MEQLADEVPASSGADKGSNFFVADFFCCKRLLATGRTAAGCQHHLKTIGNTTTPQRRLKGSGADGSKADVPNGSGAFFVRAKFGACPLVAALY